MSMLRVPMSRMTRTNHENLKAPRLMSMPSCLSLYGSPNSRAKRLYVMPWRLSWALRIRAASSSSLSRCDISVVE